MPRMVEIIVPTVMESHGILASHGKSWKMERVMEKSWNFNHLFSEKNSWAAKINKTDRKSRVWQKMQPKCAIFRQKSQKFSGEGAQPAPKTLPPLGGKYPWPDRSTSVYICAPTVWFFGHCTYKSSHGKALIWSGKVMEIDFSKVVGTMYSSKSNHTHSYKTCQCWFFDICVYPQVT